MRSYIQNSLLEGRETAKRNKFTLGENAGYDWTAGLRAYIRVTRRLPYCPPCWKDELEPKVVRQNERFRGLGRFLSGWIAN